MMQLQYCVRSVSTYLRNGFFVCFCGVGQQMPFLVCVCILNSAVNLNMKCFVFFYIIALFTLLQRSWNFEFLKSLKPKIKLKQKKVSFYYAIKMLRMIISKIELFENAQSNDDDVDNNTFKALDSIIALKEGGRYYWESKGGF